MMMAWYSDQFYKSRNHSFNEDDDILNLKICGYFSAVSMSLIIHFFILSPKFKIQTNVAKNCYSHKNIWNLDIEPHVSLNDVWRWKYSQNFNFWHASEICSSAEPLAVNILLARSYCWTPSLSWCALYVRIQVHCNCILGPLMPALFSSLPHPPPRIPRLVFHTHRSTFISAQEVVKVVKSCPFCCRREDLCCQGVSSHEMVKYSSPPAIWILQRTWIKMLKCIHVKYSGSMFKCIGNKFYFLQNVERHKYFPFQLANIPELVGWDSQPKSSLFFKYYCRASLCDQTGMTSICEVIPDIRFTYLTFQVIRPLALLVNSLLC